MDAFDQGFLATRMWIDNDSKGARPVPDASTDDAYRIDWWRGSDKAFEFCSELSKMEDVKAAMIEEFILTCIYSAGCALGVYLIAQFSLTSVLVGAAIFLYSFGKILRK